MSDEQKSTTTTIGPTIVIRGRLTSDEDLVVKGRIDAVITSTKALMIEDSGIVKANVQVRSVRVNGILVGNINASDKAEIAAGGRVVGDIRAPKLVIADGASEQVQAKVVPRADGERNQYWWVFPNLMLNIYMDMVQVNVVVPLAVDRTVVVFDWFAPAKLAPDLVEFSDVIQDEDRRICETVQHNLASRSYDRGRYSARRENGVHHFHSLLVDAFEADQAG